MSKPPKKARRRSWAAPLALGALTAVLGIVLFVSPAGDALEQRVGLGWMFGLRGPIAPPGDVVIVGINSQTSEDLGLPASPQDWPRSTHANLIGKLVEHGASTIVFDIFFGEGRNDAEDAALVASVAASGRVVLVQKLTGKRQPLLDSTGQPTGSIWVEALLSPFPELAAAASGLGPFPLPKIDAAVYEFWTFKDSVGEAPTLPAVALQRFAESASPAWSLANARDAGASDLNTAERLGAAMVSERARRMADPTPSAGRSDGPPAAASTATSGRAIGKSLGDALDALYVGPPHRFLNFYGPPGTIPTYPYQALLRDLPASAAIPPQAFAGKTVFVGFSDLYDPGQPDRFYTVFTNDEGVDLSGVEIAATAFGNLAGDTSLRQVDLLDAMLTLAGLGLLLGGITAGIRSSYGVPAAIVIVLAYAASAQWLFETQQLWLPLATAVLVQAPFAIVAGLLINYLRERRRSEHFSRTLNYYVPESVARELTENRFDPGSANRVVYSTCLATDMAGFSTLAERLPPAELAAVLNDYFDTLAGPLRDQGVDVTEFRADAIMCAWTAAQPDPQPRMRAVLAALGCVDAIQAFRKRHDLPSANLRIGLEAGTVYVGHAGGGGHFVFSIVGDCANTASRVESLNKHLSTQLLATAAVIEGLPGLLVRPLGSFVFVGKSDAIPVVEVVNRSDAATRAQLDLCSRFEAAMGFLRSDALDDAMAAFRAILVDHPGDGPSRYHLSRCERRAALSPADRQGAADVVHMDAK